MGFLSNRVKRHELNAGDHIYTYRLVYAHHGIYVGNNTVIHFTSSGSPTGSASSGSSPKCTIIPNCGYMNPNSKSAVVSSCLNCFLKNGSIDRFEYRVRKTVARTRLRGGTCSTKHEDPLEETVHRANYLLHNGIVLYKLGYINCENFASYCKTALVYNGICGQLHFGMTSFREEGTKVKVEVEELASFLKKQQDSD